MEARNVLIVVSTVMTAVATIVYFVRLSARYFIVKQIGIDDIMMGVAVAITCGYLAEIYIAWASYGLGKHGTELSLNQMVGILKMTLAIETTYYGIVNAIKASILLLYLRIAITSFFKRACLWTLAFVACFFLASEVATLAQCVPLNKAWDLTGTVKGNCINTTAFFYSTSGIHIVLDCWLIALPIRTLLSIQRPTEEKLALVFIFGMGIFSATASIVRLYSIRVFTQSKDPFHDAVPVNLWSMVEVNVAIICASIPALKCLVSRNQRDRTRGYTADKKSGSSMITSRSGTHRADGAERLKSSRESSDSMKKIRMEWDYQQQFDNKPGSSYEMASNISTTVRGGGEYGYGQHSSPDITSSGLEYTGRSQYPYP
ncbi:hypothetical protein NA57DRAFT_54204 [Rhizodiscina lignyota]|uniref:Rhodopsin domain-containing protein n=1 Tax=Rhizodiscina lignyota TaxID=1504668 RepID=A0A9P4IQB1_9PEZI|nr:hypothetical protein NA57DRAFT_54204 [Rhizodiscina lignyota]